MRILALVTICLGTSFFLLMTNCSTKTDKPVPKTSTPPMITTGPGDSGITLEYAKRHIDACVGKRVRWLGEQVLIGSMGDTVIVEYFDPNLKSDDKIDFVVEFKSDELPRIPSRVWVTGTIVGTHVASQTKSVLLPKLDYPEFEEVKEK